MFAANTSRRRIAILLLLLVLASCRKREEPEPTPTTPQVTAEPAPTVRVQETAVPTEEPVAVSYDWPPQVVFSSPTPGEEALLDGAITVRFDQPMDRVSVENAFTISRSDSPSAVEGEFSWPRSDTLIYTPKSRLERQQRYDVRIESTAVGSNGLSLRDPVELQLQTVGFLEVSNVIPGPGTSNVETDAAITVLFNRPVVPLTSPDQQARLPEPLVLDPPVVGEGEWVSTSIYRFVPSQPLAGNTRYEGRVEAGLTDVTGGVLAEPFAWSFNTLPPAVIAVEPVDGAESVNPTRPISITFNMPMDRASVEGAIRLEPAATLEFTWAEGDSLLSARPQSPLDLATTYQLVVDETALAAAGRAHLAREFDSRFTTFPLPTVRSTQPPSGQQAGEFQQGISIRFVSPMDMDTLEDKVRIRPEPEGVSYFLDNHSFSLFLDFALERSTEYEVVVPAGAADILGNTLGADFTWRFRTPPYPPLVSMNLPDTISQLSTSHPTSVDIVHRNVSQIEARLFSLGLPVDSLARPFELFESTPGFEPDRTWTLPLDTERDVADVISLPLADGGVLATGVYLLDVTAPEFGQQRQFWQNQHNLLIVADTNLVVKEMFDAVYVWATDLASGQPAAGRNLTLYDRGSQELGTAVSDGNGFARFDHAPGKNLGGVLVVSNGPGLAGFAVAVSTWDRGIMPWQFGLDSALHAEAPLFAYLHTDRPIYRPGDTVSFRGVVRQPNYGRYALPPVERVTVGLDFATRFEPLSFELNLSLDENGTFAGEYEIPADAELGEYRLYVQEQTAQADRLFTVAQYRAPEFQVIVTPAEEAVLRGQGTEAFVEASYFFGGPATDLRVEWTVYEDSYRFPWDGPPFSFGDNGGFFYVPGGLFDFASGGAFGNFLASGSGQTDGEGRLRIELPADLLADVEAGSRKVTVEATVLDVGNFPVSARAEVIHHAAQTYVGVRPTETVGRAGTSSDVELITVDWQGRPESGAEVEVVLYKREWRPIRVARFDTYFTRWEAADTEVDRTQVVTDSQGRASASFAPPDGGIYLIVATVSDAGGRTQTSSTIQWVADSAFIGWRSDPKERRMELVPDRSEYRPGDTARILVQSPFAGPVRAWVTIERGRLIEQRLVTLQTNSDSLEFLIPESYAPNVFVTIAAVKGIDATNPFADIRFGIAELKVSPERLALNVELTPGQELMQPGETAVFELLVTDAEGKPVAADVSLALVDLAVLTLKADNAPPILDAFYARQPYRSQIGSGLIFSGEGLEVEIPLGPGGLGGGGGGGIEALSAIALQEDDDDVRRDFPDTAFWRPNVRTDSDGRASIEIPLPDSVTTWRLSSKAVSVTADAGDTLVGQASTDVVVTLPLLVRPITPRFLTVGDRLQLGAVIHNNTQESADVVVSLLSTGLTMHSPAGQDVTIPAGGRQVVQWLATVDDVSFVDLTFRAESESYSDATKPTFGVGPDQLIPVTRFSGEAVAGTSGVLEEGGRRVEAILLPPETDQTQGELSVQLSPSLAAALRDSLVYVNKLEERPACAHAVTDQLLANVATARASSLLVLDDELGSAQADKLIRDALFRLAELQKSSGGWGWCYSQDTDVLLTAYTLFGLAKAEEAGFTVSGPVLEAAIGFLSRQLQEASSLVEPSEVNRQTFYLYVLAELESVELADLDDMFIEGRALMDPYARALLALSYHLAGGVSANRRALLSDLSNSAIMSASGAHWEDSVPDWDNLSSDIRGTAMILDSLARLEPGNPLTPAAVRWLMVARTAGHWPTGQENAWSIIALTDWMVASGELDAGFDYFVDVNGEQLGAGQFDRSNITTSEGISIPVSDLLPEGVNFLDFQRSEGEGNLYYEAYLDTFVSAENLPALNRGIIVERAYYDATCDPEATVCQPIQQITAGQEVRVELSIIAPNDLLFVVVEDHIPAGSEPVDPGLQTSASDSGSSIRRADQDYDYGYWGWWYFNRIEFRDDRVVFFSDFLPAGTYQYTYHLQTTLPGDFQVVPATARQEFFPDVFGRSEGMLFAITP